eukprot:m.104425 g.104425  ORF g.104425 m.104425 type:complete len:664 (-) comp15756_c0_seq2:1515-3506(-)
METQLCEQFAEQNIELSDVRHPDLLSKCTLMCRRFGLEPDALVSKWVAFCLRNQQSDVMPTLTGLDALTRELDKSEKKSDRRKQFTESSYDPTIHTKETIQTDMPDDFLASFMDTDTAKAIKEAQSQTPSNNKRLSLATPARTAKPRARTNVGSPEAMPYGSPPLMTSPDTVTPGSSSSASYATRNNAGQVLETFNPEKRLERAPAMIERLDLGIVLRAWKDLPVLDKSYMHMYEKLLTRSEELDERINKMGKDIAKKHNVFAAAAQDTKMETDDKTAVDAEAPPQTFSHVAQAVQSRAVVAGRICVDAVGDARLNAQSILLEGSRETSNGERVKLDVSELAEFSLFPGQIVVCDGSNSTGECFVPRTIHQGAPPALIKSRNTDLVQHYFSSPMATDAQAVELIVASGPYTADSDLSYAPLDDLLEVIGREKPDAVILMGPFVDAEHSIIKTGQVDVTYEELFKNITSRIIDNIRLASSHTEIVFVPSLRDVHHDCVYPQPPLVIDTRDDEKVHMFSNPCTFMIKEMLVAVNATDILMDLTQKEFGRGSDRLGRLVNHLFEQQSFYPLYPPAPGVNIDFERIDYLNMAVTPDIMIVPSDVNRFVKNVNGCLAVNPGRLTKHNTGGTYSRLVVHGPRRLDIPEGENKKVFNAVPSRAAVQIIRI